MYDFPQEKDYEGIPLTKIKRIKETFSDDDTYAVRWLKFQIKARYINNLILSNFPDEKEHSTTYTSLYQFTRDEKKRVPYSVMFLCRELIPPLYWHYNFKEDLPEATKYKRKYVRFTEDLLGKETLGHIKLNELLDTYGIKNFVEKFNINMSVAAMKNLIYKRKRTSGVYSFKNLPTYNTIEALKDFIKPDLWYIFPEEIDN